jgi:hypothetical protein
LRLEGYRVGTFEAWDVMRLGVLRLGPFCSFLLGYSVVGCFVAECFVLGCSIVGLE